MKKANLDVLIVDDSVLVGERIQYLLTDLDGISILGQAESAKEALRMMNQQCPDVILLDIGMPKVNGIEFLKKSKVLFPTVKVIMLTNFDNSYYRRLCADHGAEYFFDKSTEFEKVPQALEELKKKQSELS